jgi:hypothetical protein
MIRYYRKFIQNFSKLAKCLHKLTEKGRKFEWTNECQSAFEELKNRLVSSSILAHPDFSKKFILDTDASNEAIGAVLSQEIDVKERPIAFASRTLTKPERRYCVSTKGTMYNRHIIRAEYLKPPCQLSFGIFEV